ncbi:hypothetical protein AQ490_11330 [Wenjunlia vitaminophila]|uniref:Tryptophan synthase beta chain-like PALP domain-containing protein n=1 Tax=Wenjunlia vitaminophila TaxID=76728 RepID=A0A0T6LK54_WENVI|nr:pyridoxal-phosphate dependent enzyme [Wenjunlia vitaminophila]KRV46483.1 hypothetical protein AQ490_11330 [Wenjunlia vitaminophila]
MTRHRLEALLPPGAVPRPLAYGRLPTPLQYRPDLGADLGVRVLVKREDLLDDLASGHKARKLAHAVARARRRGADTLVTGGSLPSGQCVAVAAFARRYGLRSHLVYSGDQQVRPHRPNGAYLLALLLADEVTWHERTPWQRNAELLRAACAEEARRGGRPFAVPPGVTVWPGLLGSVELGLELADQLGTGADVVPGPIHLVAPAGSGGTCLGLAVAARLLGLPWRVHGICVGGSRTSVTAEVAALRRQAVRRLGRQNLTDTPVEVHADWLGAGYDRPTAAELRVLAEAVRRYRLPLDPTYMLRAFLGLLGLVRAGTIPRGALVVLVHTGGNLGLFAGCPALNDWLGETFAAHLAEPRPPAAVPNDH